MHSYQCFYFSPKNWPISIWIFCFTCLTIDFPLQLVFSSNIWNVSNLFQFYFFWIPFTHLIFVSFVVKLNHIVSYIFAITVAVFIFASGLYYERKSILVKLNLHEDSSIPKHHRHWSQIEHRNIGNRLNLNQCRFHHGWQFSSNLVHRTFWLFLFVFTLRRAFQKRVWN